MKVKELIKALEKCNPEIECVVFVEGDLFPILEIDKLVDDNFQIEGLPVREMVQIGCGWSRIEDEDD